MDNWILKQAETAPDRLAVDDGKTQLTFLELKQQVSQLAGQLKAASVLDGDRVAIMTKNSLLGYLMALAVLGSGKTIVWINWRLSDDEIKRQLSDSERAACLVADELFRESFDQQFIPFSTITNQTAVQVTLVPEFPSQTVASIMYTSGTTGRPKGVMQTFGNHLASATASTFNLGVMPGDEWLCAVPIFHISGFSIMMRGLIYGMANRLVDHFDAELIDRVLKHEPISTISVVPYMLKQLLKYRTADNTPYQANFRCMLLGGGPIDRPTLQQCRQRQIPVVQSYGMTETCSQISALNSADADKRIGSVGKPLFLTQLTLSQANQEVLIKTPALTPGYLNRQAAFQRKLNDTGWYRTGDVGHFDEDGFLYIDGRLDDMIISGGENIFPDEVEAAYANRPDIDEIAVVGQDDAKWGQVPTAFVVSDAPLDQADLTAYGRQKLAHYKVPTRFIKIDKLPTNASGKVQRFKLKQLLYSETLTSLQSRVNHFTQVAGLF